VVEVAAEHLELLEETVQVAQAVVVDRRTAQDLLAVRVHRVTVVPVVTRQLRRTVLAVAVAPVETEQPAITLLLKLAMAVLAFSGRRRLSHQATSLVAAVAVAALLLVLAELVVVVQAVQQLAEQQASRTAAVVAAAVAPWHMLEAAEP
jgi:hypothetical protein